MIARHRAPALAAAFAAGLMVGALPARAQVPDEFTNLQFYAKDISKAELVENMRQFCFALGVRCTHCHVPREDDPQRVADFASDDPVAKRKARAMLEMVRAINGTHLAELPERSEPTVTVSCATCHGGVTVPIAVEDRMARVRESDGMDAALAEYRELREQHLGRKAYDFGTRPLLNLAERLAAEDAPADAAAVLVLGAELHPDSGEIRFTLARAWQAAGRDEEALAAYGKVIEMAPGTFWEEAARKAMDELASP
jgi:tetratricopeptide (TPR) repeat protein